MRKAGEGSWRINTRRWEYLLDCALWIRAAERIEVPADAMVPGPLDLDPLPAPSIPAGPALGQEWLVWWRSLVGPPGNDPLTVPGPPPEPAYDTPDPLGLARLPELRAVVSRRWQEAQIWHGRRTIDGRHQRGMPPLDEPARQIVYRMEETLGRRLRPFHVEFVLLPVRDDEIRRVYDHRYLVPERVHAGPRWPVWVTDLVRRLG